jgi:hypothetical protein
MMMLLDIDAYREMASLKKNFDVLEALASSSSFYSLLRIFITAQTMNVHVGLRPSVK